MAAVAALRVPLEEAADAFLRCARPADARELADGGDGGQRVADDVVVAKVEDGQAVDVAAPAGRLDRRLGGLRPVATDLGSVDLGRAGGAGERGQAACR